MPGSDSANKEQSIHWINEAKPKRILDIGAGMGTYGSLLRQYATYQIEPIHCLEIFQPNITHYKLHELYNWIWNTDVREWDNFDYDLVIFGDVLEHMTKEEALVVWEKCSKQAKSALIAIPIIKSVQHDHEQYYDEYDAVLINKHEDHIKDDWSTEEVLESFSHITKHVPFHYTGIFWAEFNASR